jgi:hypothetical protein
MKLNWLFWRGAPKCARGAFIWNRRGKYQGTFQLGRLLRVTW